MLNNEINSHIKNFTNLNIEIYVNVKKFLFSRDNFYDNFLLYERRAEHRLPSLINATPFNHIKFIFSFIFLQNV